MMLSEDEADNVSNTELDKQIFGDAAADDDNHKPPKIINITNNNNNMNQQQINMNQQMNKSTGATTTASKSNPLTTAAAAANNTPVSNESNKPPQNIIDNNKKEEIRERNLVAAKASRKRKKQKKQGRQDRVNELRLQQYSHIQAISNSASQVDVAANAQVEKLLRRKTLIDIPRISGIRIEESEIAISKPASDASKDEKKAYQARRTRKKEKVKGEKTEELIKQLKIENALLLEHANVLDVEIDILPQHTLLVSNITRKTACGTCPECNRPDCGKCIHCLDKVKFGGQNKLRQKCMERCCSLVSMVRDGTVNTATLANNITTIQNMGILGGIEEKSSSSALQCAVTSPTSAAAQIVKKKTTKSQRATVKAANSTTPTTSLPKNVHKIPRPVKQTTKTNTKKDPNKPQRAKTARQFYDVKEYKNVKAELEFGNSSKVSRRDVCRELGRRWEVSISPEEKLKYCIMADDDNIRYKKEMEVYIAKRDSENPMSGPDHAGGCLTTTQREGEFGGEDAGAGREKEKSSSSAPSNLEQEEEFGGQDDNGNLFGDDEVLEDAGAGIAHLLQGYGSDGDSVDQNSSIENSVPTASSSGGIRNEPYTDNNTSIHHQSNNTTQYIQQSSNAADNNTSAPQQNNVGNESDMYGPYHASSWQASLGAQEKESEEALAAGLQYLGGYGMDDSSDKEHPTAESSLKGANISTAVVGDSLKISAPSSGPGSHHAEGGTSPTDVNDAYDFMEEGTKSPSMNEKKWLENLESLKPCIKADGTIDYSSLDEGEEKKMREFVKYQRRCYKLRENNEPSPMTDERFRLLSEAKFNFKPPKGPTPKVKPTGSRHTKGASLPTNVNNLHGSVSTAFEGTKSPEDVEERINEIENEHEEKMSEFKVYATQVLKNLKDKKEGILVNSTKELMKVRVEQYQHELEKLRNDKPSLPMEPGVERDVLEQKKEELESELAEAEKGMIDNANNKVVLSILQDGIDKKKDELTEVKNKLDPFAGEEASLKRKYEGIHQQDMKRLKIDGEKDKAPVQVMNMWSVLITKD